MNASLTSLPHGGVFSPASTLDALPAMIDRATSALVGARGSAELLEAHDLAGFAYDAAKRTGRLLRAKGAHDELIAAALRAQGDALLIEARAKMRLADEYDAARDRGEVAPQGNYRRPDIESGEVVATLADLGLTPDTLYRARQIRDAEVRQPGFVQGIVAARLQDGLEPNHKAVRTGVQWLLSFDSEDDLDVFLKERRAGKQAQKAEKRADREVRLGDRTRAAAAKLGSKLYAVVYADPPWRFEVQSRETGLDRSADNHYPTMSTEEICALQVPAARDCFLYQWATASMLKHGLAVMEAWGFVYKTHIVWRKPSMGLGYLVRDQHELLLIGKRGDPPAPAPGSQSSSVIDAPKGRHSAKPDIFAEKIELWFPTAPKVELFARAPRAGWDVWGNESDGAAA